MMKKWIVSIVIVFLLSFGIGLYLNLTKPLNYLNLVFPAYINQPEIVCDSSSYEEVKLTVVSYNVKHGEKIEEAIEILNSVPINGNKVFLLQEMHSVAVTKIADQLGMHSVYFPINKDNLDGKDFGNAILASMPLYDPQKIIFPHGQFHNNRRRGMTAAIACLGGKTILLGSIHASTIILEDKKRREQITYLKNILSEYQNVAEISIVGGDFNAFSESYSNFVAKQFESIDYDYSTFGLGITHSTPIPGLGSEMDYIFCDNCTVSSSGIINDDSASDHYPVWIQMEG